MHMNVNAQSQNVSELKEVNESNFPLAEELNEWCFRRALVSVKRQVHPAMMALRSDTIVSILYTAPHGHWVES